MNIHILQYSPEWEDKSLNKQKISSLLQSLKDRPSIGNSDLILFPEMTLTGFTMKSPVYAEELQGESFLFYKQLAEEYKAYIAAGIIEKSGQNYFNTLLITSPSGELLSSYRKIHPFSYSEENKYFSRGEQPVTVDIAGFKTGLSICYDLRFPELYRAYGKQRAELIINIANWPVTRIEHWKVLLRARAIENQCYVVGVNRTGAGNKLKYNGSSVLFDPMGNECIMCGEAEGLYSFTLNKKDIAAVREKFPFLDDIYLI